jgi:nucleoside-diphosphate-sugar epimerase
VLSGQKILITGPTGQIGFRMAKFLAKDNEVWGVARFGESRTRAMVEALGVKICAVDIASGQLGELPKDFTYLVHLAATTEANDYERALRVNAEATGFVLAHCREAKAALYMSSSTVYKPHEDPWHAFREEDPIGSTPSAGGAAYSITKIAAEAVARYCAREFGIPVTIARMNSAYGGRSGMPANHMHAIAAGKPAQVRWDPFPFSVIHHDDIHAQLEPLLGVASVPATIVNWGGDEAVSVQDYCAYIGQLLGVEAAVSVTEIPGASRGAVMDPTKRRSITGPSRVHWKDGMRRMVETYYADRVKRS